MIISRGIILVLFNLLSKIVHGYRAILFYFELRVLQVAEFFAERPNISRTVVVNSLPTSKEMEF